VLIKDTIYQFEHAQGVVRHITRDIGSQSKSEQLAEALAERTRIIIVTIQTFPALFEALDKHPQLASGQYAVVADEAHFSQTGSSATKLKSILGAALPEGKEPPEGEEISAEELLDAAVTAWKLAHPNGEDDEVDSKKARIKLARWVRLHPYNINQKVEVIVEHFREHVKHLLDGQAKAMVVTSSRQEAVRYQLAMQVYAKEQNYQDVHPLVAFSGTILPDDVIPEEVSENRQLLNPGLKGRDLADAFDTDDYNVMIAANKYQTGFDQRKLCAMYVDKKLKGVDCVQTLSRLNRTFPGKQTFVLDLFKKNLTSFVRAYEFLPQIVSYEDRELEQFCVFAKHLSTLLRIDRLGDEQTQRGFALLILRMFAGSKPVSQKL